MATMKRLQRRAEKIREAVQDCARDVLKLKEGQNLVASAAYKRQEALAREIAMLSDLKATDPIRYKEKVNAFGQAKEQVEQVGYMIDVLSGINGHLNDLLMQLDSMITLGLYRKMIRMVPLRNIRRLIKGERLVLMLKVESVLKKTRAKVDRTIILARAAQNKALVEKKRRNEKRNRTLATMGDVAADNIAALEAEAKKMYNADGSRK
jgi:hypothetical protein